MSSLQLVFGSVPQIYISNVMWLQVRQDIGGWKHQRIWCNDWECHIILHIAKGRVIQSYSISNYSAGFSISTLSSTSSNSCHERRPHPMTLLNAFFTYPIIFLNCSPHQGVQLRLNCQTISFCARNWLNFSVLVVFLNHPAAPTNVEPLSG